MPTDLQCWMIAGLRSSILPEDASEQQVKLELWNNELSVDGTSADLLARAKQHNITIRKPASALSIEECRGVLKSREWSISENRDEKSIWKHFKIRLLDCIP